MYDWASSAFVATVMAAMFPPFFRSLVVNAGLPEQNATAYWGYTTSLALLIVALCAPMLGAIADFTGYRKRYLGFFAGLGILATAAFLLIGETTWRLAATLFICANIGFPFPNTFVHEVMRKALPGHKEQAPFDPDIMAWRIMKLLPSLITMPGFESLLTYLEDKEGGLKLFQLSERIADLFDQYLLFRPEMMLNWEQG